VARQPLDRYVVIHVATTCDEHGVYVTKDSAEVIELGWILVDAKTLEEVRYTFRGTASFFFFLGSSPLMPPISVDREGKCARQASKYADNPAVQ
jgi:hypothetical protein